MFINHDVSKYFDYKTEKKIVSFDRQYVMIMQITHKASVSTSALGVSDGVSHMLFNYERLIT